MRSAFKVKTSFIQLLWVRWPSSFFFRNEKKSFIVFILWKIKIVEDNVEVLKGNKNDSSLLKFLRILLFGIKMSSKMGFDYDIVNLNATDMRHETQYQGFNFLISLRYFETMVSSTCNFIHRKEMRNICWFIFLLLLCFELNYSASFQAFLKVFIEIVINSKNKKKKKRWIRNAHKRNNIQLYENKRTTENKEKRKLKPWRTVFLLYCGVPLEVGNLSIKVHSIILFSLS